MSKTEPPRTEAPKADFPKDFPKADGFFGGMPFTPDAFAAYTREHLARIEAWMRELSAVEAAMVARARATTAQLAQLTQDSLDYMAQLSAEWRKLALEVTRKASDIVVPKA